MFNKIKKELYFYKRNLLIANGIYSKKIVPFDDDFYEQLPLLMVYQYQCK